MLAKQSGPRRHPVAHDASAWKRMPLASEASFGCHLRVHVCLRVRQLVQRSWVKARAELRWRLSSAAGCQPEWESQMGCVEARAWRRRACACQAREQQFRWGDATRRSKAGVIQSSTRRDRRGQQATKKGFGLLHVTGTQCVCMNPAPSWSFNVSLGNTLNPE